jgi:hypothetical protein
MGYNLTRPNLAANTREQLNPKDLTVSSGGTLLVFSGTDIYLGRELCVIRTKEVSVRVNVRVSVKIVVVSIN